MSGDLFDRPAAMRVEAVDALGLEGEDRVAGLVTGAGYPDALEPVIDAFRHVDGTVVDVGAGLGAASAWIAARTGRHVVGIEPETHTAALARRCFPQVPTLAGAAHALPAGAGRCGGASLLGTVSLLADLGDVLAEIGRVMQPGGRLGVSDLFLVRGARLESADNHFRSVEVIVDELTAGGFSVDDVWAPDGPMPTTPWTAVTDRVDAEITRRHSGSAAWRTWSADRDRLGDLLQRRVVGPATVTATRAER